MKSVFSFPLWWMKESSNLVPMTLVHSKSNMSTFKECFPSETQQQKSGRHLALSNETNRTLNASFGYRTRSRREGQRYVYPVETSPYRAPLSIFAIDHRLESCRRRSERVGRSKQFNWKNGDQRTLGWSKRNLFYLFMRIARTRRIEIMSLGCY